MLKVPKRYQRLRLGFKRAVALAIGEEDEQPAFFDDDALEEDFNRVW